MFRMCDAALVASILAVAPVMAGTPIANFPGMDMPVTAISTQPEVAAVAPTGPAVPAASAAPAVGAAAAPASEPSFEALIADFRWGDPEMGAVPHLPVPPPHRMRSEEGEVSGEDAPVDGNSGNALPLHLMQLPPPALPEAEQTPSVTPGGTQSATPTTQNPGTAVGRTENAAPGTAKTATPNVTASVSVPISIHEAAAPAPSDVDPAMLEQMMRKLATASAGEFNAAPGAAPESRPASENRSAATAESRFTGPTPQPSTSAPSVTMQSAAASGVPAAAGFASAVERAIAAANADARPRVTRAAMSPPPRSGAISEPRTPELRASAESAPSGAFNASIESLRLASEGRDGFAGNPLRDAIRPQAEGITGFSSQTFTLTSAASFAPAGSTAPATAQADAPVLDLRTPVQQPEWAESLGEKVVWLSQSEANSAQIRLNPAHLGPLEVQVSIDQDQASVSFVAQHAVTREALEAAAPRLRELLQTQGFGNVNVDISQHSGGHRTAHEQRHSSSEEKRDAGYGQSRPAARANSALDTFA
ncbi:MAG TPA: flagellar hook-length control protein FliK [Steroidobacteraceae bacterium]|nr:flagellar hook-length control protein FliK [Steroidobacteraceae bacterium]